MSATSVVFNDGNSPAVAFHDSKNDSTRIDLFEKLDDHTTVALRAFFRRMGAPHIFEEHIIPTLNDGQSQIFAAVRDRPWPPWGLGARHISAVCQVHSVDTDTFAISPVYVTDQDLTNIALTSAVYKEVLDYLVRTPRAEVTYLVVEGSTFADYVLVSNGFKKTNDIFLTESARYFTYRIEAEELLHQLGLDAVSTFDILARRMNDGVFERNALFQSMIYLASRSAWGSMMAEIIPLEGGHLYMDPPGGAPEPEPEHPRPEVGVGGQIGLGEAAFVVLEDFLSAEELQGLMDFALAQETNFVHSGIKQSPLATGVDERKRRSKVLDTLDRFNSLFNERVRSNLPSVMKRLGHAPFEIGRIEIQVTASGDGDFYQMHLDEYGGGLRELSFVYFFHRQPQRFSGGELRICHGEVNGRPKANSASHILVPKQNTMVFFPSRSLHEILPVRVPSRVFADSRFTVNGWISRK
jgi:Rps23 Pro-64 3,4-dihydroxylase Tpa1-like proline 4-hydroxylase